MAKHTKSKTRLNKRMKKTRRARHTKKSKTSKKTMRRGKKGRKHRRSRRRMHAGSSDAPLAYDPMNRTPHVLNPHMGYSGLQKMQGGSQHNVVTPFVGKAWGAEIEKWPGVSGPHDGNYYSQNTYANQPEMNPIHERTSLGPLLSGGKKRTRKMRRGKKGGMFQVFSQLKSDLTNGYREMTGRGPEPSPLPYKDQVFQGDRVENNLNYLKVNNQYVE